MQDLGVLPGDISSTAAGINNVGQIVGYSNDAAGHLRAVLWQNGTMIELSTLAPDFAGSLVLATDINDFGQITGRGIDPDTGAIIAFLATPVRH
jgi:probable HAF family extracellular repeat protein